MDLAALHSRLDDIAPSVGTADDDPERSAVEAHAATGCSRCARALLNASETVAEVAALTMTPGPRATPAEGLRARILASTAKMTRPRTTPRRFFDASGELARLHIGGPGDAERTAEIDELAVHIGGDPRTPGPAGAPREGDACDRLLAQLERVIGFPLLFVSVVRGERVGYRAQRGLDGSFGDMRDRRRETTFCTHTVSGAGPMIVPNAAEEPFFRGSNMVVRVGVKAYVGVPLTTSRGITIGTVCAMDYRPRAIGPDVVAALELFTEPVLAEIERARRLPEDVLALGAPARDAPNARLPRTAAGAPLHRAAWMRALLELEMRLARGSEERREPREPRRPSALLSARGRGAEALADLAREHEVAGRCVGDAVLALLPGADARGAANRADEIASELRAQGAVAVVRVAPLADQTTVDAWIGAALADEA